jgi:branched-subunit amino acid transport protein
MKIEIILIIICMGAVTYIPRWAPLYLLSRRALPAWFVEWLDFIPAAILSALILPAILTLGEPRRLDPLTPEFLLALPTLLVAVITRSLAVTVLTGMGLFWLVQKFGHLLFTGG